MSTSKGKSKSGKASQVNNGTADHKNQPTAEQLRIARMTADKSDTDPEMMKKIKEVSDLTGRSADEAYTALHDCSGDINQAVDLLFEKDNQKDEWHEMKKKKKPTGGSKGQVEHTQNSQVSDNKQTEKSDSIENADNQVESSSRGRRERGPPRFGRGAGRGAGRGTLNGTSNSRERVGFRGERPGGAFDRGQESGRGYRRGSGRSGGRSFRDRDQSDSYEPVQHQNIELWSNSIAENGKEAESWNNDDWDGSLEETLVLTRSAPNSTHQPAPMSGGGSFGVNAGGTAAGGMSHHVPQPQQMQQHYQMTENSGQHHLQQQQHISHQLQQTGAYNLPDVTQHHHLAQRQQQMNEMNLSTHGSRAYNVAGSLGPNVNDTYSSQVPQSSATYLSHYAKEATECIKNAVGIGTNSAVSGGAISNSGHMQAQQLEHAKQQQQQQHTSQHVKPKVPPPSKIPQSAVEMPGSMSNMQLDVQFGSWESPSNNTMPSSATSMNPNQEIHQDKQAINLQQYMSAGNLPPAPVASLTKLHHQHGHDTNSSLHLKASVEEMMTVGRVEERRLHPSAQNSSQVSVATGSGVASATGGSLGSSGGYSIPPNMEASASKTSYTSPSTTEDSRKSHTFNQPQGYGQIQSSNSTSIEKSLLSSSFQQQQQQQGMGLGSLGLSSSLGNAPPTIDNAMVSSTAMASSGGLSSLNSTNLTASLSAPSQQPQHLQNSQLQYPYNMVRGDAAGNNSNPYMYNHPFPSKNYGGDKQQPSSLVFENSGNPSALYHQSSYHHMPSSVYPGSSGMYLGGGGSSYLPSSNVGGGGNGSFHNSGTSSYQSGNLGSGGADPSVQMPSSFHHHHHQNAASNYPSSSISGADAVYHNQSGHLFRNTPFRSQIVDQEQQFQRDGTGSANVGAGNQSNAALSSSMQGPNKMASDLSKLGIKDGSMTASGSNSSSTPNASTGGSGNQFDVNSSMISAASLTTATNTTSSANLSTSATSTTSTSGATKAPNSQLSAVTKSTTQTTSGKHMMNYQGNVNLLNTNYMISQPPGFQLAPFGYQHSQQALAGYSYEELQAQRFNVGGPSFYDVPYQMTNALPGRNDQQMSGQSQSYGGTDAKLTPMEPAQPGGSLQPQQPATGSTSQQFHHPYSNINYFIPGTGLMPYIPVMPMSGMAVPMATNPPLQASVPSSQYQQKPGAIYGSHAFNIGGQSQDFTKGFNQSQTTLAKSASGSTQASSHGDMMMASGSGGFNKQLVQGFEKVGFHGSNTPSSFGLTVPVGTQTGTPGAGPAIYSGPYMPVIGHASHSQILHHTMVAQEMSMGSRGGSAGQPKVGSNKSYNAAYWAGGN